MAFLNLKPKVYIETTVVSYLVARPSRDLVIAGYQQITHDWWRNAAHRFELVISELVISEARAGDAVAARDRLAALEEATLLDATEMAEELAGYLIKSGTIPERAADDAAHIAIAVTNGIDYLVTWNFRHIANAAMRARIEQVCRNAGYEPTVICTPDELMEIEDEDEGR